MTPSASRNLTPAMGGVHTRGSSLFLRNTWTPVKSTRAQKCTHLDERNPIIQCKQSNGSTIARTPTHQNVSALCADNRSLTRYRSECLMLMAAIKKHVLIANVLNWSCVRLGSRRTTPNTIPRTIRHTTGKKKALANYGKLFLLSLHI